MPARVSRQRNRATQSASRRAPIRCASESTAPASRSGATGSARTRLAASPYWRPMATTSPATVRWRCRVLWALASWRLSPVARNAARPRAREGAAPPPSRGAGTCSRGAATHARDRGGVRAAGKGGPPVEDLDGIEDLAMREVRVVGRRDLHAVLVDQLGVLDVEPAILHRLLVKERAGIGRRQRDLDRVRVDFGRELDRLLDRLLGLARQAENEG